MNMHNGKHDKQKSIALTRLLVVAALWAAVLAIGFMTVRMWDATNLQLNCHRTTADALLAMAIWIVIPAIAVFVIRSVRKSDPFIVVAARVFVLLLPLQFFGYGGRLGPSLGLVDVGDIFMKTYCILWLSGVVAAAMGVTRSRLPNKTVNPSGGSGGL